MDSLSNKKFDDVLLDVINHRLGIVVKASQLPDLHKIVEETCKKLNISKKDYLTTLHKADSNSPLIKSLVNSITIGETYFFRDEKQMQLLNQTILPKIIEKKRLQQQLSLRIWSAGCASGEELYSIIMMLNEMLPDIADWRLHLLGTDINAQVLQKALNGQYSEWSMRAISDYYKEKYLTHESQSYCLAKKIIAQAQFNYLNLNDNTYPSMINGTNALDLILCRNVLIYFDAQHTQEIMKKFSSSLVEEGYLLLGASDPVVIDDTNLMLQVEHGKLLCRRSATSAPANKVINKVYSNDPAQPIPTIAPKRTVAPAIFIPKVDDKPDALLAKAEALANQGLLSEAAKCCEQGLRVDPINLTTYFTYAMVLVGLNEVDKAEAALRKTLFLDRDFVLGHYQLGLMLIRKKDLIGGLKSLQNAYAITEKKDATIPVPGYENLTYGKLTDILQEEIQLREVGSDAHETE